jgi:hypothetical protein
MGRIRLTALHASGRCRLYTFFGRLFFSDRYVYINDLALGAHKWGWIMRKAIMLAITVGGLAGLLGSHVALAQPAASSSIYAVKFVCGTQAPLNVKAPVEPPVKPGNYATKVNVELLSPPPASGGTVATWSVSLDGDGVSSSAPVALTQQLQTLDFTCANIVRLASSSPNVPSLPSFINGYVNVIANPGVQLAVTGVYTSQGCIFPLPGIAAIQPVCSGPVSIEVVPELAVPFTAASD